jgi:hypothetical protein
MILSVRWRTLHAMRFFENSQKNQRIEEYVDKHEDRRKTRLLHRIYLMQKMAGAE